MKNCVKFILKTCFFKMFSLLLIFLIDTIIYIRYFIYSDCVLRHVCTICTEAATGGVL